MLLDLGNPAQRRRPWHRHFPAHRESQRHPHHGDPHAGRPVAAVPKTRRPPCRQRLRLTAGFPSRRMAIPATTPPSSPMARLARSRSVVVAPPGEAADYLALAAAPPGFGNQIGPTHRSRRRRRPRHRRSRRHPLGRATADSRAAGNMDRFLTDGGQIVFSSARHPVERHISSI